MAEIYSMTGFGGGSASSEDGVAARVEIRSVNHRGAKVSVRSRPSLGEHEKNLRDLVAEKLQRGAIDVTVTLTRPLAALSAAAMENVARTVAFVKQTAATLNLSGELTIKDLLHLPGLFAEISSEQIDERDWQLISAATQDALKQVCAMRAAEGQSTRDRLREILSPIEKFRELAKQNSAALLERQRDKINARLAEISATRDCDQLALEREIVFFADRIDINEEMDRLASHLQQFRALLDKGGEVGKRLEFIAQEFLREINTTASKANDLTITSAAVEAKNSVEKLKEQVANLE